MSAEKDLLLSCEKCRDLYLLMLNLARALRNAEGDSIAARRNKFLPTEEDINPNMKFFGNLFVAYAVVQAYFYMAFQLAFHSVHRCQHRYCGNFPRPPIQVVAGKNISKQMCLQKFVYGRRELKKFPFHGGSYEFCLVFSAEIDAFPTWKRTRRCSLNILSASFF